MSYGPLRRCTVEAVVVYRCRCGEQCIVDVDGEASASEAFGQGESILSATVSRVAATLDRRHVRAIDGVFACAVCGTVHARLRDFATVGERSPVVRG